MFAVWTASSMQHTYCGRFCHVMRIEAEGSTFVRSYIVRQHSCAGGSVLGVIYSTMGSAY